MSVAPQPVASLLDRLLDDEPRISTDPSVSRPEQIRRAREAIRRDLEALLNTRRGPTLLPAGLRELRRSPLLYGMPRVQGARLATDEQRAAFAREVEATIRLFEPRLRNPIVVVLPPRQAGERLMRLRVEAMLLLGEARNSVVLTSVLDPATLRFTLRDSAYE